jgi:outer membrane protein assembly factor BamB
VWIATLTAGAARAIVSDAFKTRVRAAERFVTRMRDAVKKFLSDVPKPSAGRRKIVCGLAAAALAFALGAGLERSTRTGPRTAAVAASGLKACEAKQPSAPQPAPPCVPAAPVVDAEEMWRTSALQEWEDGHNGAALPLNYDEETLKWGLSEGKVVVTSSGRTLATAGDTLYMLDAGRRRVLWKYSVSQILFDFAYVKATGIVYATAGDNTMFILDASTGRELYYDSRNGSAGYGAVIPYGEDACLVMDSYGGYRSGYAGGYAPMQDGVTAWRGTKMLWHLDVPPDAALQVVGRKIYAVTTTKNRILVRELKVPKGAR